MKWLAANVHKVGLLRRFKMLNQRQPAIFYYFRNLTSKPVDVSEGAAPAGFTQAGISAKSPVLNLAEPNEPTQIHMSLTNVSGQADTPDLRQLSH